MFTKNIKQEIIFIFLLFLLSCLFFWKVLLYPGDIIFAKYFSDVISLHSDYRFFYSQTFKNFGVFPLWDSHINAGYPFVGDPESAMFYPLNLLYLILPINSLFGYILLLDIFLMGTFTFLFMRVIGTDKVGSFISAIIFMFSGNIIAHVYGGNQGNIDALVLLPLIFLLFELAIRKKSIFYGVLAGIPLGLTFLTGNVQVAIYIALSSMLYFLLRSIFLFKKERDLKTMGKLAIAFLLACIVAISLSAIQSIPTLEMLTHTPLLDKTSYEFGTGLSFPPEQSITFLMPEFFGTFLDNTYWGGRNFWELCVYTGVFSLFLTLVAILFKKNDYKIIFIILMVFSFLFALGKYFVVFPFFYYLVPFFNAFRKPVVLLFLTTFSISVLSGLGFDPLVNMLDKRNKKKIIPLIKILIIILVFTFVVTFSAYFGKNYLIKFGEKIFNERYQIFTETVHTLTRGYDFYLGKISDAYNHILNSLSIFLIFLGCITVTMYLKIKEKINIKQFKILVVLIILLDLFIFGIKYIDVKDPKQIFSERISADILKMGADKFRVLDFSTSFPRLLATRYNVELIGGYSSTQLKSYRDFISFFFGAQSSPDQDIEPFIPLNDSKLSNSYAAKILGLLNAKYILTGTPLENKEFLLKINTTSFVYDVYLPTNDTKNVYIYENMKVLPRAFIVPKATITKDRDEILEKLKSDDFNPKEYIFLEENVSVPLNNAGTYKEASVTYYSPNEIHVKVYMDNPGFLVLSENYYPGWRAIDNDKETNIYRADYTLRSVYLDAGQHEIKFVYDPLSFKVGLWITIITALLLCIVVLYKIKSKLQRGWMTIV